MNVINPRESAVKKAVALLKAAGAQFAIIFNEERFGELPIQEPTTRREVTNWNARYGHIAKIDAMKVGDVVEFHCAPEDTLPFSNAIRAITSGRYGPGSYEMTTTEGCVCVLLVEVTKIAPVAQ